MAEDVLHFGPMPFVTSIPSLLVREFPRYELALKFENCEDGEGGRALIVAAAVVIIILILLLLLWIGLQISPKPFPPYVGVPHPSGALALPPDLPPPVHRYYEELFGHEVPVYRSAVISGRAILRVKGLKFPSRFRFTHVAGQEYRHYIEATIFGIPLLKVNEFYLDGNARLEIPGSVIEKEEKIDMAANLSLWAESIWLPSVYIADPRVRWEADDDHSALLHVPFRDGEDVFKVQFDPQTGLLRSMESVRWKEATSEQKIRWTNMVLGWEELNGVRIPSPAAVSWEDDGIPWAVFNVEEIIYNSDVSAYVRGRGP